MIAGAIALGSFEVRALSRWLISRSQAARVCTGTRHVSSSYGVDPATMQAQLDEDRVIVTFTPTRVVAQG